MSPMTWGTIESSRFSGTPPARSLARSASGGARRQPSAGAIVPGVDAQPQIVEKPAAQPHSGGERRRRQGQEYWTHAAAQPDDVQGGVLVYILVLYPLPSILQIFSQIAGCFYAISCQAQDDRHICMPAPPFPHMLPRPHAFNPQSTAHCTYSLLGVCTAAGFTPTLLCQRESDWYRIHPPISTVLKRKPLTDTG